MTDAATEKFAALLRELKARSGRSYGALAARLHVSTSTLHRYCNGDTVPADYAPVERLARLCGATADELVELHRRWLRASGARHRSADAVPEGRAGRRPSWAADAGGGPAAGGEAAAGDAPAAGRGSAAGGPADDASSTPGGAETLAVPGSSESAPAGGEGRGKRNRPAWRGRRAVLAAVAVTATVLALVVTTQPGSSEDGGSDGTAAPEGSAAHESGSLKRDGSAKPSAGESASGRREQDGRGPSAAGGEAGGGTGRGGAAEAEQSADPRPATGTPLAWSVRSHVWEAGCDHRYLLDKSPSGVPPPPMEQDAAAWAASQGAVHGGTTNVEVVLEPRGGAPVTINAVHVRKTGTAAPLPWTAFAMSDGCGGEITEAEYRVDLDVPRPVLKAENGWDGSQGTSPPKLPYRVTPDDPLSLLVHAATDDYDVRWYLEVAWSSGDRSGVIRVDDSGTPFRTSSIKGRPLYGYFTDAGEWVRWDTAAEETPAP